MRSTTIELSTSTPLVLHVVQFLRGGGAETFVRELIPRLVRRGIDARALCAYGASQLTDAEALNWTGRVYCQERSGVNRLRYLDRMRRIIREVRPDIVHTHTQVGAFWGRTAALLERTPIIVHTEHRSKDPLPLLERVAHKFLNPRTTATVAFSERTAELVRRREEIRDLHVIPNGIRVRPLPTLSEKKAARRRLDFADNVAIGGMVASLESHKNPALCIEAIALLPVKARQRLKFVFFGDGTLRKDLEERVHALRIADVVHFLGFRSDMPELYPGLDFVVSTSAREMMPMSLLEAMNAALPIVGTPHLGTLDLVVNGETGIILKAWNERELADAIAWIATHPEWSARAGRAAYARLGSRFDVESAADQYAALYRTLLNGVST